MTVPAPVPAEWLAAGRTLWEPVLSPDGCRVAVGATTAGRHELIVVELGDGPAIARGPERSLLATPGIAAPHPFGGGAWCWLPDSSGVVHAAPDGGLWLARLAGGPSLPVLTCGGEVEGRSLWSPAVSPDGTWLAAVAADAEHETIVIARLGASGAASGMQPVSTAAFAADPAWAPDGSLLWHEWDDPHMPWTSSRVVRRAPDGTVETLATGAVGQPRAAQTGGRLGWIDETAGWREVHVGGRPAVSGSDGFEHAEPTWGPGQRTWCWSPDGTRLAWDRNEEGFGRLCVASPGGAADDVGLLGKGVHLALSWSATPSGRTRLAALRTGHRTPTQLVVYDPDDGTRTVVAHSAPAAWDALELPEPEVVHWDVEEPGGPSGSPAGGTARPTG